MYAVVRLTALTVILQVTALPQDSATVSGTVVDYPSLTPLPGFHVRLLGWRPTQEVFNYGAVTDKNGRFSITQLPPAEYRPTVDGPSHYYYLPHLRGEKRVVNLILNAGDTIEGLTLHVSRLGVITGRLIGDDGEPIANTSVSAMPENEQTLTILPHIRSAYTDEHGSYRLLCSPGMYRVWVDRRNTAASYDQAIRADGGAFDYGSITTDHPVEVRLDGETRMPDLRLPHQPAPTPKPDPADNSTVVGKVTDGATGRPVGHARVLLWPAITEGSFAGAGPSERLALDRMRRYYGITKADGTFTLTGLAPGPYLASANSAGYMANSPLDGEPCLLKNNENTNLALSLYRGSAISGRVYDDKGNLRRDVPVHAVRSSEPDPSPQSWFGFSSMSWTNEKGEFRIHKLKPGRFRVYAAPDYHDNYGTPPELPDPSRENVYGPTDYEKVVAVSAEHEATGIDIRLKPIPLLHISGHVKSEPGVPPPGRVEFQGASGSGQVRTGPGGSFTLWRLVPGRYQLIAYTNGTSGEGASDIVTLNLGGESIDGVELSVHPPSRPNH